MAQRYDLLIDAGANFERSFEWADVQGDPINLTGFTVRMQIRQYYTSQSAALDSSTGVGAGCVTIPTPLNGRVELNLSPVMTEWLSTTIAKESRGVYDIELVSVAGKVSRLVQGDVSVTPNVTRVMGGP